MPHRRMQHPLSMVLLISGMGACLAGVPSSVTPRSCQASAGTVSDQPLASSIGLLDSKGKANVWASYVEFAPGAKNHVSTHVFAAPPGLARTTLSAMQLTVNYQGPSTGTQTWTWWLYDWTASRYVKMGTNAGAQAWGAWKTFTFPVPVPLARFIHPQNGTLQVQLSSNNAKDSVDIDYEAIVFTPMEGVKVTVSPATATLHTGAVQSFQVQVSGATDTRVAWSCTAGTVTPEGRYTAPATPTTCWVKAVSLVDGTASASAEVRVVSPTLAAPKITRQPTSQTVRAGQAATFTAEASGMPAPTFQWQRLVNGAWVPIPGATAAALTTAPATASDSGTAFRVVAANSEGSDTSQTATLTVDLQESLVVVGPELKDGVQYTSVQAGLNAAKPGQTVRVKPGVYREAIVFPTSGQPGAPITLQGEPGAILDGAGRTQPLVTVSNRSHVRVVGFELRNLVFKEQEQVPIGILVQGPGEAIELRGNTVHGIDCLGTNGHGIAVYGTGLQPLRQVVIADNEVYGCRLGESEAVVVNGHVDGFDISGNRIHDNDNIGIDCIGHEPSIAALISPDPKVSGPLNVARNGRVTGNRVWNITSKNNPAYHGETSADGIYVDGGASILIEGNIVDQCDIGIECASEWKGKVTRDITVRNNLVSRSRQGNIMIGGSDDTAGDTNGGADAIRIFHNTTFQGADGEVVFQNSCRNIQVKNNVFVARTGYLQDVGNKKNNTGIAVEANLYHGSGDALEGFTDPKALFADPRLVQAPGNLHLMPGSPAMDRGVALGLDPQGAPLAGTLDVDGQPRQVGAACDLGADEVP